MKTTKVSIPGRRGIDDLKGVYAFTGNSQGDHSASNSIEDYLASKGWMSFMFDCPMTEEDIAAEVEKRKAWNENYIRELHEQGRYGEGYTTTLEMVHNPILDNPLLGSPAESPLESYSAVFFDASDKTNI